MIGAAEKPKVTFKDFYKSLNREKQREIRDGFLMESDVSYPAFYAKLRRNNFSKLELKALKKIIGNTVEVSF